MAQVRFLGSTIYMNTDFNLITYLKKSAEKYPGRCALIMHQKGRVVSITFEELWDKVDVFSVGLRENGLQAGEHCLVLIPMSIELYIIMLGIIKMGGVAVFIEPWIRYRQIVEFCVFAQPRGFIGMGKTHLLRLMQEKLLKIPLTISTSRTFLGLPARFSIDKILSTYQGDGYIFPTTPTESAIITFTSGSSGIPKGVNRTHGILTAQYKALSSEFHYSPDDIDMPMFPVFALRNIAQGITSVIPNMDFMRVDAVNPQIILNQMNEFNVTTCTASPPFFDSLSEYILSKSLSFPIRRILTGGAPVSNAQLRRWRCAFPDTQVEIVYGSTEAEPIAHITLEDRLKADSHHRGFCVGGPIEGLKTKIIKIQKGIVKFKNSWQELECSEGEVGELIVSGAHVCKDYFNNPAAVEENKITDSQGTIWHRMGDTGYFDENGLFWLVGRVYSTIIRDNKVYHAQLIEQTVAESYPAFTKIAALGLPDAQLGEQLTIVIQTKSAPVSVSEIKEHLKDIPIDKVLITSEPLPVDPRHNSKIDYTGLRRMILNKELKIL